MAGSVEVGGGSGVGHVAGHVEMAMVMTVAGVGFGLVSF